MRIAVTGASGFLGRAFVRAASMAGHEVYGLGRTSGGLKNSFYLDLTGPAGWNQVPWGNFEAVVHLAAAGVKSDSRAWPECISVNVVGVQRLLSAIEVAGSTPHVWLAQTFYEREAERFTALLENPYIVTKRAGNELARDWAAKTGRKLTLGQIFQVYGPGDSSRNVLCYAAGKLIRGESAQFGSGQGLRDWIFLDDAAGAILASLWSSESGVSEVDIGTGVLTSIRAVVEQLADTAGAPRHLLTFDPANDRGDTYVSARAKHLPANWAPETDLAKGLRAMLKEARSNIEKK